MDFLFIFIKGFFKKAKCAGERLLLSDQYPNMDIEINGTDRTAYLERLPKLKEVIVYYNIRLWNCKMILICIFSLKGCFWKWCSKTFNISICTIWMFRR